jgi:predicted metal-dependent enzyme (double-stranded beta helix superfamily)
VKAVNQDPNRPFDAAPAPDLSRLRAFVYDFAALLSRTQDEALILELGGAFLGDLVAHDDWLPDAFAAEPSDRPYAQHLLHCDSLERFCVVSFVWSPGQGTPVHDHTVWGLVGVLRGAELSQSYAESPRGLSPTGPLERLNAGQVAAVSPRIGDIHRVVNAFGDRPSVSIHVYGGNIGAIERSTFDAAGQRKRFISGYSNTLTPNLWNGPPTPRRRLDA